MNAPPPFQPPPFQPPPADLSGPQPAGYGGPPGYTGSPFPGVPAPPPPKTELARRAVIPLILAHVAVVGPVVIMPVLFLGMGSRSFRPQMIYEHFKEGGWGMWGITALLPFIALAILVLGIFMIRGKRIPGAIPFFIALGPYPVALLGALAGEHTIMGAISGASVDASQKGRILGEGMSELSNLFVYGGAAAAFASYAAAMGAILALFTIDPAPLAPAPKSAGWIIAMPAGLVAAILAGVLRAALHISPTGLDFLVLFGMLTIGLLAGGAGKVLPALVA
jgi:hypothetical protein